MARRRTAQGRLVQQPGIDPLEEMLQQEAKAAAWRAAAAIRPDAAPLGRTIGFGSGRMVWQYLMLAKMGVSLTLVDRGIVERHNLRAGNSVLSESDIGKPKAMATRNFLKENAPGVHVEAYQADINLLSDAELRALSAGARLVLCNVDDGEAMFRINQTYYEEVPVVYAAGHRGAKTGDVMFSRPGGACLRCLLNSDSPQDIHTLAGEPTHGIDIIAISEVCARVALILLGDTRLGDLREMLDPTVNFVSLQNRRSPTNPRGFAPQFLRVRRRPNCPVCGALKKGGRHERRQR